MRYASTGTHARCRDVAYARPVVCLTWPHSVPSFRTGWTRVHMLPVNYRIYVNTLRTFLIFAASFQTMRLLRRCWSSPFATKDHGQYCGKYIEPCNILLRTYGPLSTPSPLAATLIQEMRNGCCVAVDRQGPPSFPNKRKARGGNLYIDAVFPAPHIHSLAVRDLVCGPRHRAASREKTVNTFIEARAPHHQPITMQEAARDWSATAPFIHLRLILRVLLKVSHALQITRLLVSPSKTLVDRGRDS
jgi:hypothetical protein